MKLYIDPGTGSMLFAILIGIIGALNFLLKGAFIKLKFLLSGGKSNEILNKKIPFVIFADDKRYWNVFEPVCRELDKRGFDTVYMTASENDPGLKSNFEHVKGEFIGEGNKAFSKLNFLKASVVLSTTPGLDVYQWKRSKDVDCYIHILHAANEIAGYRMFGIDYYDAIMISGDYQLKDLRALEKKRNLPEKEVVKIGIPYMDDMARRLANSEPVPPHNTTVLIAPSWGKSAIFSKFGGSIIDKLLKAGFDVIVRPHPQSFVSEKDMIEKIMKEYPDSEHLCWNRDNDNFECLKKADILISDFSGVIFDFTLVYDKPVIYADTKFDRSPYDCWWLDTPYWTFETLPKIGMKLTDKNLDNIKDMVNECLSNPKYAQGRDIARSETWVNIGKGAQTAADFIVEKYNSIISENEEENGNSKELTEDVSLANN